MNADQWNTTVVQNLPTYPMNSIYTTLAKAAVGVELLMDRPEYWPDLKQLERIVSLIRRLAIHPVFTSEDETVVNALYGIYVVQGFDPIPDFHWTNQALFLRMALCVGELYTPTDDQLESFDNLVKIEMSTMISRKFTGPKGTTG
jgi:hypothetical protein